jgi:hypothetical protein
VPDKFCREREGGVRVCTRTCIHVPVSNTGLLIGFHDYLIGTHNMSKICDCKVGPTLSIDNSFTM